jgi:hypothetical protein
MTHPTTPPPAAPTAETPGTARLAPAALWFAFLGGAVAWFVHLLLAWSTVEVTCTAGHDRILGVGLRWVAGASSLLPLLVAVAACGTAAGLRRRLSVAEADRRTSRAHFMAEAGLWMDVLAIFMIVMGGVVVALWSPCAR